VLARGVSGEIPPVCMVEPGQLQQSSGLAIGDAITDAKHRVVWKIVHHFDQGWGSASTRPSW